MIQRVRTAGFRVGAHRMHCAVQILVLLILSACFGCGSKSESVVGTWLEQQTGTVLIFQSDGTVSIDQANKNGTPGNQTSGTWIKSAEGIYTLTEVAGQPFSVAISFTDDDSKAVIKSTNGDVQRNWSRTSLTGPELDKVQESMKGANSK